MSAEEKILLILNANEHLNNDHSAASSREKRGKEIRVGHQSDTGTQPRLAVDHLCSSDGAGKCHSHIQWTLGFNYCLGLLRNPLDLL